MRPNLDLIQKQMEIRHWSGSQLAQKMGISRMEVSRILRGKHTGGKKVISGLIKAFPDVPFAELFILS